MRRLAILGSVSLLVLLSSTTVAAAGTLRLDICAQSTSRDSGDGLTTTGGGPGFRAIAQCGTGLSLIANGAHTGSVGFKVTAPAGIMINSIHVVSGEQLEVGSNNGWWGEFYWNGGPGPAGRSGQIDSNFAAYGCCSQGGLRSQSIGWFIACGWSSCPNGAYLAVGELQLAAEEDGQPTITPVGSDNLWYQSGWVRGTWPAAIQATDPSGVCDAFVSFGSLPSRPFKEHHRA